MADLAGHLISEVLGHDGGRRITVYVPPDPANAFVFAADGGWHTAHLAQCLEDADAPPTMIIGVDGLADENGRLKEYVQGFDELRFETHERFFVDEVRGWVASQYDAELRPERTAIWGASLGAELALAMGLRHPDVYGAVLAASPGAGFRPPEPLPSQLPRVYLVAGRQEPFFLENAERWVGALRGAKADAVLLERDGEHGGAFWGQELPLMVTWAFGPGPRQ